jgi:ketosteroid isomerase-like protein
MADFFKQLEQDWEDAVQARDIDKVAAIEADDLRSVGFAGSVDTKQDDLSGLKSGKGKHVSLELGPVEVKMLSNDIAVVQSSATERGGAGADGPARAFAFMDVFVKRGGKWMVVRSLAAKVK